MCSYSKTSASECASEVIDESQDGNSVLSEGPGDSQPVDDNDYVDTDDLPNDWA